MYPALRQAPLKRLAGPAILVLAWGRTRDGSEDRPEDLL